MNLAWIIGIARPHRASFDHRKDPLGILFRIHPHMIRPLVRVIDLAKGQEDPQFPAHNLDIDSLLELMKDVLKGRDDVIRRQVAIQWRHLFQDRLVRRPLVSLMRLAIPVFQELLVIPGREVRLTKELVARIGILTNRILSLLLGREEVGQNLIRICIGHICNICLQRRIFQVSFYSSLL